MSCAKHKFFALNPEFVHKVVHNFVQSAGIARKSVFSARSTVEDTDRTHA
jgi:hypothetical protein